VLRIDAIHPDISFTRAVTAAVHRELDSLAEFVELRLRPPS
jgi:hypothetical protein